MAMSYKARKFWAMMALLIGLPVYIGVAWGVLSRLSLWQLPVLVEFVIYVAFGLAWILPLKPIFKGVGQADPDAPVVYDDDGLKK
jgi:predicted membrane channel-forming protein YqfA (hemolysin III family)